MVDAPTMAAIAAKLDRTIRSDRGQRVVQTSPLSVGLDIYAGRQRLRLVASADTRNARVHLTAGKPTRDPKRQPLSAAPAPAGAEGRGASGQRIAETSQALAWLAEMTALVDAAESYDEMTVLAKELEEAGVLTARPGAPRRREPLPPRAFRSGDGYTILVGRNARQNEVLTLHRA